MHYFIFKIIVFLENVESKELLEDTEKVTHLTK